MLDFAVLPCLMVCRLKCRNEGSLMQFMHGRKKDVFATFKDSCYKDTADKKPDLRASSVWS